MIKNISSLRKFTTSASSVKVPEWIDPPAITKSKVKRLAQFLKEAKHAIIFTGAGISTSVGIPDYRSGPQTVVKTGPGMWNRTQEQRQQVRRKNFVDQLTPSISHMVIKTLIQRKIVKFLVSQNTDGLHLRSGVPSDSMVELHGNRNLQKCLKCKTHYFRDYRTLRQHFGKDNKSHLTGRFCQNCNGQLTDSIIYFGQKLPETGLRKAYAHALNADLCICIGSSLTVRPSSNVPGIVNQKGGNLCIINIQQTPFDHFTKVKINDFSDRVMQSLLGQLQIPIERFKFEHYLELREQQGKLTLIGKNANWQNYSFVKEVIFQCEEHGIKVQNKILLNGPLIEVPINTEMLTLKFYGDQFNSQTGLKMPMRMNVQQLREKLKNKRYNSHQKMKIVYEDKTQQWRVQDYDNEYDP